LLQFVPVFIGTTAIIYALVFAIPGDPVRALFGDRAVSASTLEAIRAEYNLNDPLPVQYGKYIAGVLQGDFGEDFRGRPVTDIMAQRLPVTIKLAVYAFVVEIILGIAAGVLAGLRRKSFIDQLVLVSTVTVISIPVFVLGFLAQLAFGVGFDIGPVSTSILPVAGIREGFRSFILPATVLAAVSLAYIARLTRTSLVENMRQDYVRTATAKGLRRTRVVGLHALRNSMIPVITFLGIDLGALMGGAIVTETIFNLPGIGQQVYLSVLAQEGTVVVGITTFLILVFLISNLAVDLLYGVLDPRIRYE
jgi:ABC-type dipeptide/oligopeptide/nickel transport system permease component